MRSISEPICSPFFQHPKHRLLPFMAPKKAAPAEGETPAVVVAPTNGLREGETVFGVAHIYASFNDTFVHVTDLSGKVCRERWASGGGGRDEPHAS